MIEPALLLLVALAALSAIWSLRSHVGARASEGSRTFQLQFPRETSADDVTTFLAGLSAGRPPLLLRWLQAPTVVFETRATARLIDHLLIIPPAMRSVVLPHLRAAMPNVRFEEIEAPPQHNPRTGIELATSTAHRPLRVDRSAATSSALLSALQPLRDGEEIVVQWLVTPAPIPQPPRLATGSDSSGRDLPALSDGYELLPHAEALRAERSKQAEPLFACVGRLAISAADDRRARYLLSRVRSAFELLTAPGVHLRRRLVITPRWAAKRLAQRTVPVVHWPATLHAGELAAVLGFKIGDALSPALPTGIARQLPPSAEIPSEGCVIGTSTYPGAERPLAISVADRRLHMLLTGPTGSGKTTEICALVTADAIAGRGVVVIEPKDLVTECMARIPEERIKDVIIFDVGDVDHPVGVNLLDTSVAPPELVAENIVHIFLQLFGSSLLGPRSEDLLRSSVLTGMTDPKFTLVDLPLLISNAEWRRPYVERIQDDIAGLREFWQAFEALKPNDAAQVIAPLQNKLRSVLRKRVTMCLGQTNPRLNIREALDTGKLLFIPLRAGLIGDTTASLVGSAITSAIWSAVQARADQPAEQRKQVHLYIDEAPAFLKMATSLGEILATSRSYGLAVTVAAQHLGQWPSDLLRDVLANCRSKITWQTTAQDARTFEAELKPYVSAEDLQHLGQYEVIAQLAVGQRVMPPVTAKALPPPPLTHNEAKAIAWSRQHYGRPRLEVEAEIRRRHQVHAASGPVGRKPAGGRK